MSPPPPADLDQPDDDGLGPAHHGLSAGKGRRSKLPLILGIGVLALLGGAGAWIALTDPFGRPVDEAAPAVAPGNLLGEAWSFESSETSSPSAAWLVPEGAPAGFSFVGSAAVTGRVGAAATFDDADGRDPWASMLSAEVFRIPPGGDLLQLSGTSSADDLSLMVRYLADGRPTLDTVVASGRGRLVGHSQPPPGTTGFQVGFCAVGDASVDDLDLRFVNASEAEPAFGDRLPGAERPLMGTPRPHGLYSVLVGDPRGLTVFHGAELMMRIEPASLRSADGSSIPASAGFLPGTGETAGPGGIRAKVATELLQDGRRMVLAERVTGVPEGAVVVHQAVVAGSLTDAPLGIRSPSGFDRFSGDFRVEGVDALLMGPTSNRLVLEMGVPFTLAATHREDGTIALSIEFAERDADGSGTIALDVALQAEFKEERVAAAQLRDSAEAHEKAGRLGAALGDIEVIVQDYPYDESVLEAGLAARARIQALMQERLDALDEDLEDALFLGSAERCREVLEDALSESRRFVGSDAEALFLDRARSVEERAASLLEEDVLSRRRRVEALADSYAAHGDYPLMADELRRYLAEHLTTVLPDVEPDAGGPDDAGGDTSGDAEEDAR